eukprot:jgi/Botrbrau1/21062/Bobra.0144s0061.1
MSKPNLKAGAALTGPFKGKSEVCESQIPVQSTVDSTSEASKTHLGNATGSRSSGSELILMKGGGPSSRE